MKNLHNILYISNFLLITFVAKQIISGIPNVQIVVLLMALFAARRNILEIFTFMLAYVILDFLVWGYPTLMIPSFLFGISWMLIAKKVNDIYKLSLLTIPLTIFHMLIYMFHDLLLLNMPWQSIIPYLIAGIPYAIPFLLSSIFSILYLYEPIIKVLGHIEKEYFKIKSN